MKNARNENFIDHRKPVCRQKQTKTAVPIKIAPHLKIHNPAANKSLIYELGKVGRIRRRKRRVRGNEL